MPTISEEMPNAPAETGAESHGSPEPVASQAANAAKGARARNSVALVWSDALFQHRTWTEGLGIERLRRGYRLLEASGALHWREIRVVAPDPDLGNSRSLALFHDDHYIQAVKALSRGEASAWSAGAFGFAEHETPTYPGMDELARWFVAASRTAVASVLSGETIHAFSVAGAQVHARRSQAANGDIFNDVLLALRDARQAGKRVAFVSLEAEHPLVIQEQYWQDPGMLLLSMHEAAAFHYPGTGHTGEIGEGEGRGFNVNIPLPPGAGDDEYRWIAGEIVEPLLRRFEPEVLVLLTGSTAHYLEPLAHLRLTSAGYQYMIECLLDLSPHLVVLGGGGTDLDVSARLWTLEVAQLAGRNSALPRRFPAAYAQRWGEGTLLDPPLPALPYEMRAYVEQRVRAAVWAVQRVLFPLWELPVPEAALRHREEMDAVAPPVRPPRPLSLRENTLSSETLNRRSRDEIRARLKVDEEEQLPEPDTHPAPRPRRTRPRRVEGKTQGRHKAKSHGKVEHTERVPTSESGASGASSRRKRRRRRRSKRGGGASSGQRNNDGGR